MARTFTTISRPLTREEKKETVNAYKKINMPLPGGLTYADFMKSNEEFKFVKFKWLSCGFEDDIEEDLVISFLNHYEDQDYPEYFCHKCIGTCVPLDIYNEKK